MKTIIPINTSKGGVCKCITAHYSKSGWENFAPYKIIPNTAVMEIITENSPERNLLEPKILLDMEKENKEIKGVSVHPLSHAHEFGGKVQEDVSPCLRATDHKAPHCVWEEQYRDKRLQSLVESGKIDPEKVECLDTYNQAVKEDVSHTITTTIDSSNGTFISEPTSCASRKRGDGHNIETRKDDVANCVTSIDTDSMVAEPLRVKQATKQGYIECPVGGVFDASYPTSELRRGRVQENGEVSPALTTNSEGAVLRYEGLELQEPAVLTNRRTEEGKELRKQGIESFENRQLVPREDGCSGTLTSVQKDNLLQEPSFLRAACGFGKSAEQDIPSAVTSSAYAANNFIKESETDKGGIDYKGKFIKEGDGLYAHTSQEFFRGGLDGVSRTLKHESNDAATCVREGARYRIRKLTEREVFRLMDVSEEDIDKIQLAGISKTAQYRLAGNSIVTSCLYHIFRKMFVQTECETQQLSLF